ncbi:HET-domain-containing protein [Cucurbitaria berberidis CBS 394.84]|uniref:HET-domain-containing protein n=1 Tax=Cucurbitaria berberidis CBS 394.84 TaxID=1168544 RepID=A0A9P4GMR2_9PLEO|nr:HET-domain-containing protein [Cucurbitaria berberidis CBS 394.84]KAF1847870.1 HET-domain-containing protein [Cucurbitaria berberidis CBS 394.84]
MNQDLRTEPWNVREDSFPTKPIPKNTGDIEVAKISSAWLDACRHHHVTCEAIDEARQSDYYPNRLLDIGNLESHILRLIHTKEELPAKGNRYATLSHCWGDDVSFIRLTDENMASLNNEIRPQCPPKSFTDAVITCRRLRIRYLWIDSLCIQQSGLGSEVDWQIHVAMMHTIYANGVLNLAIAHASSPDQGAFVDRDSSFIKTAFVYAPGQCCLVTISVGRYDSSTSLFRQPLFKRGWVFQERLMTPRMLIFGDDRVYWECHERTLNEYLPTGLPDSAKIFDDELSTLHVHWYTLMGYYSRTELTYPEKDKLAAVAAIARRFGCVIPGRYCAGLFESDIPIGLLWYQIIADQDRSPRYRAPTWSWASVDGSTIFNSARYAHKRGRIHYRTLANVESIAIELKEPRNPFGQVLSAELVIRGTIIQLPAVELDCLINSDCSGDSQGNGSYQNLLGLCIMDAEQQGDVHLYSIDGIILSHVGLDTYKRIGKFKGDGYPNSGPFPIEDHERRTITIV